MKYKFTPSQIGLLKDCPKCFWLMHNKKIRRPDGIFPSLPSGMDRTLKRHFDEYMKKDELPPEIKQIKGVKLFSDLTKLDVWRNNFQGLKYDTDKFLLKGAVDAILVKTDNNKLIVLDYKTRGYPLKEDTHKHYIDQQALYNYLLRKNGYETEDYSYLLFYHPDKVVENVFIFHTDLVKIDTNMKIVEDILKKALDILEGDMPEASIECKYCKYKELVIDETPVKKEEKRSTLLDY